MKYLDTKMYCRRRSIALGIILAIVLSLFLLPFIFPVDNTVVAEGSITTTPTTTTVSTQGYNETPVDFINIYDVPLSVEQQTFVQHVAIYYNISPEIIYGIMSVESNFDTQAKSKHCIGIMQVDERYASQWIANSRHLINCYNITDVSNLYDFKLNVILGCQAYEEWAKIISDKNMDLTIDTLGAYNNGYNYIAQPDYEYAAKVLTFALYLPINDQIAEQNVYSAL